jgi:hypothetical protein
MSDKVNIPSFYLTRKWQDSIGKMSFMKRIEERIYDIERKLPNMTLKEKQELYKSEPYWEISKLIIESKDWVFPNK